MIIIITIVAIISLMAISQDSFICFGLDERARAHTLQFSILDNLLLCL